MFARMTIMMIQPDRIDEAIAIYKKSVLPAAKKQKGYEGACLLSDRGAGKGISVTFWKTEEDAFSNEANLYYQEQLAKFLDVFSGPPIKEGYEIVVHALPRAESKTKTPVARRAPRLHK
jgi:heme-degrading monooxygenase HmoA